MSKTTVKKTCKAAEAVAEIVQNTQLQVDFCFPCPVYLIERFDFLEAVSEVANEALEISRKTQKLDEIYPVVMSGNFFEDVRLKSFCEFVGGTAWNILNEQGYDMQDKATAFTEMWVQEHYKHSAMEQHAHGYGAQIVGFYFLETPENCSRPVFYDPRAAKVQIDLPEADANKATPASKMINFEPKPGRMIFTNAWLAHSFTRHAAEQPLKFVHFNMVVVDTPASISNAPAEIV
jgi:uncharacterized protein (TIGR02466 family)